MHHRPKKMSQYQKQPPELFYRKSCYYKFRHIHRKTHVLESPFNRFAASRPATFLKSDSDTDVFK